MGIATVSHESVVHSTGICPECGARCNMDIVTTFTSDHVGPLGKDERREYHCDSCGFGIAQAVWTAGVTFQSDKFGKMYHFKVDRSQFKVEVGDLVIVECSTGIQLVKIRHLEPHVLPNATAWVIGTVDLSNYHSLKRAEEKRKKDLEELKKLKKEMDARFKQLASEKLYQELSEKDDKMKDLWDRYRELKSGQ